MKAKDLIINQIYIDVTDKDIPIRFSGKIWEFSDNNITRICAEFTTVKTEKNKNWYNNSGPVVHLCFDPVFDNTNIV